MQPDLSPQSITVQGLEISYVRSPGPADGDPVLVLHGWGASIAAVMPIVRGLGACVDVIAVDLPGFGDSAVPPEPWSPERYAEFVVALADALQIERFSIVGHSAGARIAIVVATETPERVSRLLLTGAAGLPPKRPPSYYGKVAVAKVGRAAAAVGGGPGKRLQDRMRQRVASADWLAAPEAMRGTLRLALASDLTDRLPRISCPTLLVWGEEDGDTPIWMGERMEELIPDAGLVRVPGGGHYAYADEPQRFNAVARHFLGTRRPVGRS